MLARTDNLQKFSPWSWWADTLHLTCQFWAKVYTPYSCCRSLRHKGLLEIKSPAASVTQHQWLSCSFFFFFLQRSFCAFGTSLTCEMRSTLYSFTSGVIEFSEFICTRMLVVCTKSISIKPDWRNRHVDTLRVILTDWSRNTLLPIINRSCVNKVLAEREQPKLNTTWQHLQIKICVSSSEHTSVSDSGRLILIKTKELKWIQEKIKEHGWHISIWRRYLLHRGSAEGWHASFSKDQ